MNIFESNWCKPHDLFCQTAGLIFGLLLVMITSPTATAQNQSLLWKISGNGLEKPSYLFGTIHMICPEDLFFPEDTQEALDASAQVMLELDMDEDSFAIKVQQMGVYKGTTDITEVTSRASTDRLNLWLKSNYGADLSQFGFMKPISLMGLIYAKQLGCEQIESYEQRLVEEARNRSLEVLGLETLEYQMGLFDRISIQQQVDWINHIIDYPDEIKYLVELYKEQDLAGIQQLIGSSGPTAEHEEWLLFKRNENWLPIMEKEMRKVPTFFAVGAGHLAGVQGIIHLLRTRGYQVQSL